MIEFLTAKGAIHYVEQILNTAQERIVLVSPYLQISRTFFQRMEDAAHRGVPITMIARETIKEEERDRLLTLPKLELYSMANLHAKCYLSEKLLVITSLNLYEYSEQNREMGVLVTADESLYASAKNEVESILRASLRVVKPVRAAAAGSAAKAVPAAGSPAKAAPAAGSAAKATLAAKTAKPEGFCIRCKGTVALNPAAPLCRDCWSKWAVYENEEYPEKYCHACGRQADTTKARPRCDRCYARGEGVPTGYARARR